MKYLNLRKSAGALFLVSALFLIMGGVIALSDTSVPINADFISLNVLCVILMIAAGILALMLKYKNPILAILGTYIILNIAYSFYYSFKYDWFQEGFGFALKWMSSFILPTGFLSSTSPTSILVDLTNLSVIVGAILFAVSIKPTSNQNQSNSHSDASISVGSPKTYVRTSASVKSANLEVMSSNELASPAVRLGSYLLEALFTVVTLGIGWLIWSFVIWGKGTTPGHQVVRLYIVSEKTGQAFSWGQMFVREILVKGILIPVLSVFSFGIVFLVDSLMVVRDDRKTLHDRICGSIVVQR